MVHAVLGDDPRGGPRRAAGGCRRVGRDRPRLRAHPSVAAAADDPQPGLDQRRPLPDGSQQAPHRRPRHRVRPGRPRAWLVSNVIFFGLLLRLRRPGEYLITCSISIG